jgi:predicted permease
MNFETVALQVTILFIIAFIGFIAGKTGIIPKDINSRLTDILLYITMPLLIIISFQRPYSAKMLQDGGMIIAVSLGIHIFAIFFSKLIYKKVEDKTARNLKVATVFANCGFMGFPVIGSIYGSEGIFYVSFYIIVFNILIWTYGVSAFNGKGSFKSFLGAFLKPGPIAIFTGIILFVAGVRLPKFLHTSFDMTGSMTTPLSMIIIGVWIANSNIIKLLKNKYVYIVTLFRLLIIPAIVFTVLYFLGFRGIILSVAVLLSGMPTGVNTAIFAEKFNGNPKLMSGIIGVTTILSIITINLFVYIISIM